MCCRSVGSFRMGCNNTGASVDTHAWVRGLALCKMVKLFAGVALAHQSRGGASSGARRQLLKRLPTRRTLRRWLPSRRRRRPRATRRRRRPRRPQRCWCPLARRTPPWGWRQLWWRQLLWPPARPLHIHRSHAVWAGYDATTVLNIRLLDSRLLMVNAARDMSACNAKIAIVFEDMLAKGPFSTFAGRAHFISFCCLEFYCYKKTKETHNVGKLHARKLIAVSYKGILLQAAYQICGDGASGAAQRQTLPR